LQNGEVKFTGKWNDFNFSKITNAF
jgi:hypothetical protein